MNWPKNLKVKFNEPLRNKTTFRIGGPAQYYCEPKNRAALKALIVFAKSKRIPVFILGAGSNLLISDKGLKGLTVKLNAPVFRRITRKGNCLKAGCAVALASLVKFAYKESLGNAEFLAGIPGSAGGAVYMNAGCWGSDMGGLVKEVEIMDYNGNIISLGKRDLKFRYRRSNLSKYIILSATLSLKPASLAGIRKKINGYLLSRRKGLDLTYPNAGCIFRNPSNMQAGRLIDLCGLKGRSKGSACVSLKHANFIINKGGAKARDVLELMRLIKKEVKGKFKVNLQPELKIWG